ncbi:hypothetical protein AAC387_Pa02g2068 [Persea americana]
MLLLSAASLSNVLPTYNSSIINTRSHIKPALLHCSSNNLILRPIIQTNAASSSSLNSIQNRDPLLHVSGAVNSDQEELVPSASAVAAAIRRSSTSPVEIVQLIERAGKGRLVLPSPDFQRLCLEQLDLFRSIVDRDAILSVYVRPAGSYVMDRLELRRVTFYPGMNVAEAEDIVILIGNFAMPTGLRAAEATLSNHLVQVVPECRSMVFPMVKHPFVVGFLVAEIPTMESEQCINTHIDGQSVAVCPSQGESYGLPLSSDGRTWEINPLMEDLMKKYYQLTVEQRSRAVKISHSLAMAYVMDQKAILLQQSSWQNNVRMSNLVDQMRGSLSSIRTLGEMLSVHMKKNEVSLDIIKDILVQGDRMRDALQELQDAVYLTKANIVRYNEETLKKMQDSTYNHKESAGAQLPGNIPRDAQFNSGREMDPVLSLGSGAKDLQMPMPPLTLAAPQQLNFRPCNVSDVLADLVAAAGPLAHRQQRSLGLSELSKPSEVAVEESALRQALSNLIEGALLRTDVGGKVQILSSGAPAGGALIVIDDDGPDMHFMTQMHYLTPFGADLLADGMVEDNMTWNFIAGLTIAREILETYGCVVRVVSPRSSDAALGAGGTHIELWMPAFPSDLIDRIQGVENR